MSTDSTELTFVRCPSCRSLVPAVSTRCRMCGASLDASNKVDALGTDPRKSGRVRQRTMSAPKNPLNAVADQVRQEHEQTSNPEEIEQLESSDGLAADDPLGAYIEEVEITETELEPSENGTAISSEPEDEDLTNGNLEASNEPAPVTAKSESPRTRDRDAAKVSTVEAEDGEPEVTKPKVILESGGRRQGGRPGGLQFGRPREEAKKEPTAPVEKKSTEAAETQQPNRAEPDRRKGFEPPADWREEPKSAPQPEQRSAMPPREERVAREDREDRRPAREEPRMDSSPLSQQGNNQQRQSKIVTQSEGRLFGWLVSYSNPQGEAIELREGRFFITGAPLKPNDLLIKDSSISTPHAMVSLGAESGFLVRDLMSEHGIQIKRKNAGGFERVGEEVTLNHGDWVRFGQVEFLVSLVAHVGIK